MMQLNIKDFLQKLAAEANVLPEIREQVQAEIDKYEGMRLVLSNTNQNPEFTENLLSTMDAYLENLKMAAEKFRHPHLVLFNENGSEEAEMNQLILQILKAVNSNN